MLILQGKFLAATTLEARGSYPPTTLLAVLDPESGEALHLVSDQATFDALAVLDQFADVAVKLRWRKMDLASLGGSGRGKAYRLQVVGLLDGEAAS